VDLQIELCKAHIKLEDFDAALKIFENRGFLENREFDLLRLYCFCKGQKLPDALKLINKLKAENSPHLEDAVLHTAKVLNDVEKYRREAFRFIHESIDMFPNNFNLHVELCYNLELQGKTKKALDLCCQLIDEDPYSTSVWYMQGRIYALSDNLGKAIESFDFALTCITDEQKNLEYEIKHMKAFCLYKNENFEKAIDVFTELEMYDEFNDSEVYPFLAECYMNMDNFEKAYHLLKQVIGNEDVDEKLSVYGHFIYCCLETDRRNEALDALTDSIKYFPSNILEYLTTLKIMEDPALAEFVQKKKIVTTGDLARDYLSYQYNNN
jgi:tetratricopeptide (TPR) repeat protein